MSCSLADIRFEMASILYNIGALHTQLGAAEPRTTPDSLKAACTHYQQAAWAFNYLKEQYPQPSGADISTEILSLLQEICFAQAQECILDKCIQDTKKPSVIGMCNNLKEVKTCFLEFLNIKLVFNLMSYFLCQSLHN